MTQTLGIAIAADSETDLYSDGEAATRAAWAQAFKEREQPNLCAGNCGRTVPTGPVATRVGGCWVCGR